MANIKKEYTGELVKLATGLLERGIKFKFYPVFEGGLIEVLDEHDKRIWDAVCHKGSYGREDGLLEIMGSAVVRATNDEVEGWLTAEEILERVDEA